VEFGWVGGSDPHAHLNPDPDPDTVAGAGQEVAGVVPAVVAAVS
jgi:hypothetical protein